MRRTGKNRKGGTAHKKAKKNKRKEGKTTRGRITNRVEDTKRKEKRGRNQVKDQKKNIYQRSIDATQLEKLLVQAALKVRRAWYA